MKDEGVKFDADKPRFDLIPAMPLTELAKLYGVGAKKYADRNWEKGMAWSRLFAATQRHLWAFWNGEDMDQETRVSHLTNAVFGCFALREYMRTHPELDDRPSKTVYPDQDSPFAIHSITESAGFLDAVFGKVKKIVARMLNLVC